MSLMDRRPKTGVANLRLHGGRAPRWLFDRMVKLSREVVLAIVLDFGPDELVRRTADPSWFQALGCVVGFDWHSSGVTTTLCGALKEGLKGLEKDIGLFICGGKGRTSRQTPADIVRCEPWLTTDPSLLVYASRMAAKVDNAALQDGYQLYHHTFLFTSNGSWGVVQQGMNEGARYARRYHWLSDTVEDFTSEPHSGICSDRMGEETLNLVAEESAAARATITQMTVDDKPEMLIHELEKLKTLDMPRRHYLTAADIHPQHLSKRLLLACEGQPQTFEQLLHVEGVGARTIRALSLISEVVYGVPASFRDPARYSFAHGGKDGHPFPVDRRTYDRSIALLSEAVSRAKLDKREKLEALRRLSLVEAAPEGP